MKITPAELAGYIDHTLLNPGSTLSQIEQLCDEALKYQFHAVCVNSCWVPFVVKKLKGSGIKVCSVIGFPIGAMDSRSKACEAKYAVLEGADELDMVINNGALKSRDLHWVEEDIREVKRACKNSTILKVIIETVLLTDEEKVTACELSKKAGADFVKTCTGFMGGGATEADIDLMRRTVGSDIGVKASGMIRDYDTALSMIKAGANRLGCRSGVVIMEEAIARNHEAQPK